MYNFDELTTLKNRIPLIGVKAEGLINLRSGGFNVPDGFVVTVDETSEITEEQLSLYADAETCYAVRSSGTSEDMVNSSFAGQYDSFLNVRGYVNLKEAIRKCAQSLHNERVAAYARQSGIDISGSKMAVIVQRMVNSEKSGVAFSIDSVNGHDKEIIIEAIEGLGDELVSGHVTPDYYSYNWYDEKFTTYGGGVLTQGEVRGLAETVLAIQADFGYPVDVEWAITEKTVHILQCRPITVITYRAIAGEWTTADFRDGGVSSAACKALMASLYGLVFNPSFTDSLKTIKLLPQNDNDNIYGVFFARPYWNLTTEKTCFSKLPGYAERDIDEDMGVVPVYEGDGITTKLNLKSLWSGVRALIAISLHIGRMGHKAEGRKAGLLKRYGEIEKIDLTGKSADELHDIWLNFVKRDYFDSEYTYFGYIFCNMVLSTLFKDKMKKHVPMSEITGLLAGLSDISHIRPVYDLWNMSRREYSDGEFNEFIVKYGYRSQRELDISYPNWDEAPDAVRRMIAGFKELGDDLDPRVLVEKQGQKYVEALKRVPVKLHKDVERLRAFLRWREEFKDVSTRYYYMIRRLTLALGKAWEAEGILEAADDIFFLSVDNIETKSVGMAAKNKIYYSSFINFKNPNEIGSRYAARKTRIDGSKILKGVPCGGETVTATARVIRDIHDADRLETGDILVTNCTDPAWTAAFSKISGVVTETGGMLSHAAVVSREYGLACILMVKDATEVIRDGDVITLDCKTGEIYQ